MKFFSLVLSLFAASTCIYGQVEEVNILSPKAASILKYGEYPVSLHTGLIDISVPVFTIEASGVVVPIELKYHASGLKYDDVSNEVGLGWTLIAGGVITRSIRGSRDGQLPSYSRNVDQIKTCDNDPSPFDNDYIALREVENGSKGNLYDPSLGRRDGEMDVYSFSFLKHSGSFCFPFLGSEVGEIAPPDGLFIPVSGMKVIDRNQPNVYLELLDADGVFYRFEVKDVDQNEQYKEYYLTRIISANKADTIDFTYEVVPSSSPIYIRRPFINYTSSIASTISLTGGAFYDTEPSESGGLFYQSLRPPRLLRIDFKGGYVSFEYNKVNNVSTWDLQRIKIHSLGQTEPIQTVALEKGIFSNGEQRLEKVTFANDSGDSYDYEFAYDGEPGNIHAPGGFEKGIDYWGYFNGETVPVGKRYVPLFNDMPTMMFTGLDRAVNESFMKRGVLNKVIYPTKGYSEFYYEAHKARLSEATPVVTCGGLRIAEVRNYLADGTLAEKKWYKYGENESGAGFANAYPNINDFLTESRTLITVYREADWSVRLKTFKHWSSFPKLNYFFSGSSVVYGEVTEYTGNEIDYNGKTVYRYEVFPDEKLPSEGQTYRWNSPNVSLRSNAWKTGNLSSKAVFKKGSSQPFYFLKNHYIDINTAEFRNVRVLPYVDFEYVLLPGVNQSIPDIKSTFCLPQWDTYYRAHFGGSNPTLSPYDYFNFYTTSGLRVLAWTEETIDGVTTITKYDAYNADGLPTDIVQATSTGEERRVVVRYPSDLPQPPYPQMQAANIITPVIERRTYKNDDELLRTERLNYAFWHSRFFALSEYTEQYGPGDDLITASYRYDEKGNVREVLKEGVVQVVYLWGYSGKYPIAEIRNATFEAVETALGQALIERVANASSPSPSDLAAINGLRSNPALAGSHVTTYSYLPLVGMTSKTDPNGLTTHYEYDSFGRLKRTKDHDDNIRQSFNYHYQK